MIYESDSQYISNRSIHFSVSGIPQNMILDAHYDFLGVLRIILSSDKYSSEEVLSRVKILVEERFSMVDTPHDSGFWPFWWYAASPLAQAIYRNEPELVEYFLSKGANPYVEFREQPLLHFVEIYAKQTNDDQCLTILRKHIEENITDTIGPSMM